MISSGTPASFAGMQFIRTDEGVTRRAAGNIQSHSMKRRQLLAQHRAVFALYLIALPALPAVKGPYVFGRAPQDAQKLRRHSFQSRLPLFLR
jgi:hypothetical protein